MAMSFKYFQAGSPANVSSLRGEGVTSPCESGARQPSRKRAFRGAYHGSQPIDNTLGLIMIFPEDGLSWESLLRKASSSRGGLTVGFGFGAAANPYRAIARRRLPTRHTPNERVCAIGFQPVFPVKTRKYGTCAIFSPIHRGSQYVESFG